MAAAARSAPRLAAPGRAFVAGLLAIGMVVSVISSLGAPLIPTIAHDLHASLSATQWSLTATLLVGAVASPLVGRRPRTTRVPSRKASSARRGCRCSRTARGSKPSQSQLSERDAGPHYMT